MVILLCKCVEIGVEILERIIHVTHDLFGNKYTLSTKLHETIKRKQTSDQLHPVSCKRICTITTISCVVISIDKQNYYTVR